MMQALELLWLAKSTSWAEAKSNSAKIRPIVLAVIKLCLSKDISKGMSQSAKYMYLAKKLFGMI